MMQLLLHWRSCLGLGGVGLGCGALVPKREADPVASRQCARILEPELGPLLPKAALEAGSQLLPFRLQRCLHSWSGSLEPPL